MSFGGSGSSGSIAGSTDVALSNPATSQVLTYNGTVGKWQNQAAAASAVSSVAGRTGAVVIAEGDVTNLTSDLSATEKTANKGTASGYAPLNSSSQVPIANLPVGTTSSTVMVGNDTRVVGALQTANNLSELTASASTVRTNLGLGTAATHAVADFEAVGTVSSAIPIMYGSTTATIGVTASDRAYVARTLKGARMRVAGAPVGSSLIVQVQHYDGSSWTTLGTLTITTGSTVEATSTFTQAQVVGNLVRLNITSVGSTTAATGVAVDVIWG